MTDVFVVVAGFCEGNWVDSVWKNRMASVFHKRAVLSDESWQTQGGENAYVVRHRILEGEEEATLALYIVSLEAAGVTLNDD